MQPHSSDFLPSWSCYDTIDSLPRLCSKVDYASEYLVIIHQPLAPYNSAYINPHKIKILIYPLNHREITVVISQRNLSDSVTEQETSAQGWRPFHEPTPVLTGCVQGVYRCDGGKIVFDCLLKMVMGLLLSTLMTVTLFCARLHLSFFPLSSISVC